MSAITGLLKPCYVYAPRTLLRRIGRSVRRPEPGDARVQLPWGAELEVNPAETIGRELLLQNVFDISVSEAAWRILGRGDRAVDVGANVGYMTSLFAARVGSQGRVDSFEPHPRVFARLQRNSRRWERQAVIELHQSALGAHTGTGRLVEPGAFGVNEGTSTLAHTGAGAAGTSGFEVRMEPYDVAMADARVRLLKIDVEGFEGAVLQGAKDSLSSGRVRNIIYEAHDLERSPLHALLEEYGYSIFGVGHDLFGPRLSGGPGAPRVDARWESPNYLATLDPGAIAAALRPRGWQVLRGC